MERSREVGHVDESVGHRGARETAIHILVLPHLAGHRDIAGAGCGVDAAQGTDALAMPRVLSRGDVDAAVHEHGRRDDLVRSLRVPVQQRLAVLDPSACRVRVELPHCPEGPGLPVMSRRRGGIERVAEPVAAPPKHERLSFHHARRGIGPLPVKDSRAHIGVVRRHEFSCVPVQHNQARGLGRRDVVMVRVYAVGCAYIEQVADDEDGAVAGVLGPDVELGDHVVAPDDIGVDRAQGRRRAGLFRPPRFGALAGLGADQERDVLGLVLEGSDVSGPESGGRQGEHLALVGHQVDAVAVHRGRGADAVGTAVAVEIADGPKLGNHELPEEFSGGLVEAHQDATVALQGRIARDFVVRPDEDSTGRDGRVAVGLAAEPGEPLHVLRRGHVDVAAPARLEGRRKRRMTRPDHVASVGAAPVRPVVGGRRRAPCENPCRNRNPGNPSSDHRLLLYADAPAAKLIGCPARRFIVTSPIRQEC